MTYKNVLFDEIKSLKEYTYTEALAIARMYQHRERTTQVRYSDSVKGQGMLMVTSMGIINKSI